MPSFSGRRLTNMFSSTELPVRPALMVLVCDTEGPELDPRPMPLLAGPKGLVALLLALSLNPGWFVLPSKYPQGAPATEGTELTTGSGAGGLADCWVEVVKVEVVRVCRSGCCGASRLSSWWPDNPFKPWRPCRGVSAAAWL